jgi:hypothetical protein
MSLTFAQKLQRMPAPGGAGCHTYLLSAANVGVREGLEDDAIFDALRVAIPPGGREVPDREIMAAVRKARSDGGKLPTAIAKAFATAPAFYGEALRAALASESADATGAELRVMSRTPIPDTPGAQFRAFVSTLYDADDLIYTGTDMAGSILPAGQLAGVDAPGPKFIPNPLTGAPAKTKDGARESLRCDGAVAAYRYALVEMDGVPLGLQTQIWTTIVRLGLLPVSAVTYSGGKSLHGLLRLSNIVTPEDWDQVVKADLFPRTVIPLGGDKSCANPSRLSRTPGAQESERGVQWLLFLDGSRFTVNPVNRTCKP